MTKLKWCIKRTPENYKEVNEWANKVHSEPFQFGNEYRSIMGYVHSDLQDHGSLSHEHKNNHYTEITLDEFRLLTDMEKRKFGNPSHFIDGTTAFTDEDNNTEVISTVVFNELQRMWKEREGKKELYSEVLAMDKKKENEEKFMSDWRNQTKLGIEAMNKVIKALDKQNKLLRKLIKKQNTKRNEKTIM